MQPSRTSRRAIIEIDINEVAQRSDTPRTSYLLPTIQCQDQSAMTGVTRPTRCQTWYTSRRARVIRLGVTRPARVSARVTQPISCWDRFTRPWVTRPARCQATDKSHRARVTKLGVTRPARVSPSVAGTGSLDPGSLDQRAARPEARSAEQESLDSGSLNPHASQHGSLDPPVAATGSLDPGSLDQRVASPRTSGSSVSILPQEPEAAGVAEYIVLAEAEAQVGIAPDGPADQHIPVAVATEAPPVSVQWTAVQCRRFHRQYRC
jgi:hypothetical protein